MVVKALIQNIDTNQLLWLQMADYDIYGNAVTPDYAGDYGEEHSSVERSQGFMYVKLSLDVWLGYPLAIILNLMLFIKFVRTPKIKGEPWRWLIVNTSFIAFLQAFLLLDGYIGYNYHIPTIASTALCPFIHLSASILYYLYYIFNFLIIIERFHALRLRREEGGFDKKAVISCLVMFWLVVVISIVAVVVITPLVQGLTFYEWHDYTCYVKYARSQEFVELGIWFFLFPAFLTVFIGTLVLRNRPSITPELMKSNVKPTLAASGLGFLLLVGNLTLDVLPLLVPAMYIYTQCVFILRTTLPILHMIAFLLIWIITWSKNGDISFPCCKGGADEERLLLETK